MITVYFDEPKINWPRMTGSLNNSLHKTNHFGEPDNSIVLPCSWFPHPMLLRSPTFGNWIPVFFFFFKVRLALLLHYTGMCSLAEYRNDIKMAPKSITEVIH